MAESFRGFDFRRMYLVLISPGRCVASLKARPAWLAQYLTLVACNILVAVGSHSLLVRLTIAHLPIGVTVGDEAAVRVYLDARIWARTMFLPLRLMAGYVAFALLVYLVARAVIAARTTRFVEVFSLTLYAETVLVLGAIAGLAAAMFGVQENPALNPLGIDLLLADGSGGFPGANVINPFTLWYLVLMVKGIATIFECRVWKSMVAVGVSWGIVFAMEESVLQLLKNAFQFRL